ncbi:MAG: PEP-CTERM system histidine kinase PrsK [Pseudomonadales bacterium]|nr:PEP-CTERM system histidine kinase PrsK [Halioglobus sp.]MCP5129883.1 PEP-CTERM system histidine kinase PrsK [Pseudomonadales bacterium]
MPANISLYSYGFALLAYTLLGMLVFFTRAKRPLGWPLTIASAFTALWATSVAVSTLLPYPLVKLMQLAEVARNAAWCFVLLRFLGLHLQGSTHILASNRWIPWFMAGVGGLMVLLFVTPLLSRALGLSQNLDRDVAFAAWLSTAIFGLLLLEQIFRNSTLTERWSIKYLCLGLGFIFAYDFFMYAEALLFRQLNPSLWQARGLVVALAAVFLAIALGRSERANNGQNIHLSRHVVFHSVTLLAAGLYLILMALVGYFIRYLGGTWGGVLQIAFLCGSGLLLVALLFSGQIRARTRVWLSKNFFSYKYDYRTEWLQFTMTLGEGGDNVPENITRAMANLTQSSAGVLWSRSMDGHFQFACNFDMPEPDSALDLRGLSDWMQRTEWIIDLREWRRTPDLYEQLEMPAFLEEIPRAWLIIPLLFGNQLQGILLLRESDLQTDINWEDRDLLKVAGRQAASHLAQYQANQALVESRQFEAFNRLSAYVIHDLKNILAQQSLIVSNAEKHRDKPAFIDDVINTVRNSVERMTRLMDQMKSGLRGVEAQSVDLVELLESVVEEHQKIEPRPMLQKTAEKVVVEADRELLATVFSHIIQNAQEATSRNGEVTVRLLEKAGQALVEIEDNGAGMDDEFLRERLFKPFDSTKGLTGMGIGAFESREFVRSLGGDIRVSSKPGAGSIFRIALPRAQSARPITITGSKDGVGE